MPATKASWSKVAALACALGACGGRALANPPAPYHLIYGMARDQYGTPLTATNASVILQSVSGVQLSAAVVPGLAAGVNYQIKVAMDDGAALPLYRPDALTSSSSFSLLIAIGSVTNAPLELRTNSMTLGAAGGSTRFDLTVGTDANGDGIPDAWEYAYLALLGLNMPLSSLNANSILGSDGLTLRQEYLIGLPVFDPGVSFDLALIGFDGTSPIVEFTGATGRSYTVLGSSDLKHWTPLAFRLTSDAPTSAMRSSFYATDIQLVDFKVVAPTNRAAATYLKLQVQ